MTQEDNSLLDAVKCIIESASSPLSEYQLITSLNEQGWALSIKTSDSLALFTSHFLVFNALYRLQLEYWQGEQRYLEITALAIYLHPASANVQANNDEGKDNSSSSSKSSNTALGGYNNDIPLREYYLDLSQLEKATEDSVNGLLDQFWNRFVAADDVSQALAVFSLDKATSYKEIKQRYRTLAMKHHPDRGGDADKFRELNAAFGALQKAYYT